MEREREKNGETGRKDAWRKNTEAWGNTRGCVSISSVYAHLWPENQGGSSGVSELAMDYRGFILEFHVPFPHLMTQNSEICSGLGGIPSPH